ncbi:MAG: ATP-binding protein [Pseudomonadota bacterium]
MTATRLDGAAEGQQATRAELEAGVQLARRNEALVRLAGSVAHDFNNVLAIVMMFGQALIEDLPPDDPSHADAVTLVEAAARGAEITRQMLAFGQRTVREPEPVAVSQIVAGMEKLLRRLLGGAIELRVEIERGGGAVLADRGEIGQVVLNLAINARDAVGEAGRVVVGVRPIPPAERDGPCWIEVFAADDGRPMSPAEIERALAPVESPRQDDVGPSVGLASIRTVAERWGGRVEIARAPGRGTRVNVLFPCLEPALAAWPAEEERLPGGLETLLVVEDDPQVLRGLATLLRRRGYQVITAHGAGDALLAAELHDGPLDLLLADPCLERLNGFELARRLRARHPRLGLLFLTGAATDGPDDPLARGEVCLIKPVSSGVLARRVREVLDRRA